jgi:hypothetical protein
MSNRRNPSASLKNPSASLKNPSGFLFTVKRQANPSGSKFVPNIDLSKPVIKHKAKNMISLSSKKGGRRKTYRKTHKKRSSKTRKKRSSKTRKKK